jgi:adenine-specific DNA-methyltransferase
MVIPASRPKYHFLVKTLRALIDAETDGPRRLVRAVLFLWQKEEFPLLGDRAPFGTSALLENATVIKFSRWLSNQSFNDAAFWLASAYANWVGEAVRTEQALYFTPPKLADRVLDDLVSRGALLIGSHWHDPACGGAAFLVPTAQRMASAMSAAGLPPEKVLENVQKQLSGSDLDKTLLKISEQFLRMALYPYIEATGIIPKFELLNVDGLLATRQGAALPDVLVCNPPYRKLNSLETKRYQSTFDDVIRNQPNVYGLFIRKTLDTVKDGGLIGLLTPTSYLSGASFSKLRGCLLERSDVLQIDMLSDRGSMFISVKQEIVVTILRAWHEPAPSTASTDVFVLGPNGDYLPVGHCRFASTGAPWPVPRSVEDAVLLNASLTWMSRLSDYSFTVKVGHLIAFRDKRKRFSVRPIDRPQNTIVPLVWAGDITMQGLEHGRVTRQLRTDYFVEVSDLAHSSVTHEPSVVLQRLTSNDQPHRLIAAAVPAKWQKQQGGFVAENHVIVMQTHKDNHWTPDMMASILNSPLINRLYRSISGAANVAVSELNELPLPDPAKLSQALGHNKDINIAIRVAFGLCD